MAITSTTFVESLYTTVLHREADAGGAAHWIAQLDGGAMTQTQVTDSFIESNEFAQSIAPIANLYYAIFNREADKDGLNYWVNSSKNGMSLEDIASSFISSAEYQAAHPTEISNDSFVESLYVNTLGRASDAGGKEYWINALANGMTKAQLILGFSNSAELANTKGDSVKAMVVEFSGLTSSYNAVTKGIVSDGYISGATVFADANGDGIWNPGEAKATTNASGEFTLTGGKGSIVATGGKDISTGLTFDGKFTAPKGSTTVSALSTLVDQVMKSDTTMTASLAATKVAQALGISSTVNLLTFDPIKAASDTTATAEQKAVAMATQAAAVQVTNMFNLSASMLEGAGVTTEANGSTAAAASLASMIVAASASSTTVDIKSADTMKTFLDTSATKAGATTAQVAKVAAVSDSVATATANLNSAMSDSLANAAAGTSAADIFKEFAKTQVAAEDIAALTKTAAETGSTTAVTAASDKAAITTAAAAKADVVTAAEAAANAAIIAEGGTPPEASTPTTTPATPPASGGSAGGGTPPPPPPPAADTTAPTATLTYSTDGGATYTSTISTKDADTLKIKATFSEAIADATGATITINNSVLTPMTKVSPTVYTYDLDVPSGDIATATVTIGAAKDAAGNVISAAATNNTFTVDNTAPTATATLTSVTDDVGNIIGALSSLQPTDDTSLVLAGAISQELAAGEVVAVYDGATKLGNATVTDENWTYTDLTLTNTDAVSYTVKVQDAAGNASTPTTAFITTIDTVAPTLASSSPADNAVDMVVGNDIVLTFSENVIPGTGNVTLYKASDDSVIQTIDTAILGGSNITFAGKTVTINPTNDLVANTDYYIKIDATAIRDAAGHTYAGISDKTTLNFTTPTAPSVVTTLGELQTLINSADGSTSVTFTGSIDTTSVNLSQFTSIIINNYSATSIVATMTPAQIHALAGKITKGTADTITAQVQNGGTDISAYTLTDSNLINLNNHADVTLTAAQGKIPLSNTNGVIISDTGSIAAADINTINDAVAGTVKVQAATAITGSAAELETLYNAVTAATPTVVLNNQAITSTGLTSFTLANQLDAITTGVVTAQITEGAITTLQGLSGTGNAYTITVSDTGATAAELNALYAKTTLNLNASAVTTIESSSVADVKTLIENKTKAGIDGDWTVTLSDTVSVADANIIDAATSGAITATIAEGDIATLKTLSGTGNNYTITVTDTGTTTASDLKAIDATTTSLVDASSITAITALEASDYALIGGASASGNAVKTKADVAVTLATTDTMEAVGLKVINEKTTGLVDASAVSAITGIDKEDYALIGGINATGNAVKTKADVAVTFSSSPSATNLNTVAKLTSGVVTAAIETGTSALNIATVLADVGIEDFILLRYANSSNIAAADLEALVTKIDYLELMYSGQITTVTGVASASAVNKLASLITNVSVTATITDGAAAGMATVLADVNVSDIISFKISDNTAIAATDLEALVTKVDNLTFMNATEAVTVTGAISAATFTVLDSKTSGAITATVDLGGGNKTVSLNGTNNVVTIANFATGDKINLDATLEHAQGHTSAAAILTAASGGKLSVATVELTSGQTATSNGVIKITDEAAADWNDVAAKIAAALTMDATAANNSKFSLLIDNGTDTRIYNYADVNDGFLAADDLALIATISSVEVTGFVAGDFITYMN